MSIPFPNKKYRTIVFDPPWPAVENGTKNGIPYETMDLTEIERLLRCSISQLTESHAYIYIWFTNSMLPNIERIAKYCKIKYKSTITWCKPYGLGRPPYSATEFLVYFSRGSPLRPHIKGQDRPLNHFSTTHKPKHSEKPDEAYKLIERISSGPYIDMFARKQRDGWDVWGNEIIPNNTMKQEDTIQGIIRPERMLMNNTTIKESNEFREYCKQKGLGEFAKTITVPKPDDSTGYSKVVAEYYLPDTGQTIQAIEGSGFTRIDDNHIIMHGNSLTEKTPEIQKAPHTILADVISIQEEGKKEVMQKRETSVANIESPERKIALEYLHIDDINRKIKETTERFRKKVKELKAEISKSNRKIKKIKALQDKIKNM